ncbi:hypothetical protein AFLA_001173 [Aspergillus flavus NRRL3357]|nr:hypothetical protein AFLA_001173 [Aspergillus flavus NRRL3357]
MLNEYESPSQFKLLNSWRESIFLVIKKYIKPDERLFNLIQASIDNIPSLIYSRHKVIERLTSSARRGLP